MHTANTYSSSVWFTGVNSTGLWKLQHLVISSWLLLLRHYLFYRFLYHVEAVNIDSRNTKVWHHLLKKCCVTNRPVFVGFWKYTGCVRRKRFLQNDVSPTLTSRLTLSLSLSFLLSVCVGVCVFVCARICMYVWLRVSQKQRTWVCFMNKSHKCCKFVYIVFDVCMRAWK